MKLDYDGETFMNYNYEAFLDYSHQKRYYGYGYRTRESYELGPTGYYGSPGLTGLIDTKSNDSITTYELERHISTYKNMVYNPRDLAINLPKELINMVCEYIDLFKFNMNTIRMLFTHVYTIKDVYAIDVDAIKDVYAIQNSGSDYILIGKTHCGKYFNSYHLNCINEYIESNSLLALSQHPKFCGISLFYNQQIKGDHGYTGNYNEIYRPIVLQRRLKKDQKKIKVSRKPSTIHNKKQKPIVSHYNIKRCLKVQKQPKQQTMRVTGFKRKN